MTGKRWLFAITLGAALLFGCIGAPGFPPITQTPQASQHYVACGCGCCGGMADYPAQCLYHSKGDSLDKIIQEDLQSASSPSCATMGCSRGINYTYCD
ncbi:MAG: hypothetical protein WC792_01630 [Candidatus Micrarchaeia archaeon]